jgi:hypothetical protein
MPQTELLENENHFPDCVFVKLIPKFIVKTERNEPSSPFSLAINTRQSVGIELTIRFGTQEIEFPGGTVSFGLRRGELRMKLENGKMPIEEMGLVTLFQREITKDIQTEKGFKGTLGGKSSAEASNKITETAIYKECTVYTKGTEEEPIWNFLPRSKEKILFGQLTKESLGRIDAATRPCKVEVAFTIRGSEDLYVMESAGLGGLMRAKNISSNKTAVLTREFFLRFIWKKVQLQSYLSRVQGQI